MKLQQTTKVVQPKLDVYLKNKSRIQIKTPNFGLPMKQRKMKSSIKTVNLPKAKTSNLPPKKRHPQVPIEKKQEWELEDEEFERTHALNLKKLNDELEELDTNTNDILTQIIQEHKEKDEKSKIFEEERKLREEKWKNLKNMSQEERKQHYIECFGSVKGRREWFEWEELNLLESGLTMLANYACK